MKVFGAFNWSWLSTNSRLKSLDATKMLAVVFLYAFVSSFVSWRVKCMCVIWYAPQSTCCSLGNIWRSLFKSYTEFNTLESIFFPYISNQTAIRIRLIDFSIYIWCEAIISKIYACKKMLIFSSSFKKRCKKTQFAE